LHRHRASSGSGGRSSGWRPACSRAPASCRPYRPRCRENGSCGTCWGRCGKSSAPAVGPRSAEEVAISEWRRFDAWALLKAFGTRRTGRMLSPPGLAMLESESLKFQVTAKGSVVHRESVLKNLAGGLIVCALALLTVRCSGNPSPTPTVSTSADKPAAVRSIARLAPALDPLVPPHAPIE